MSEDKAKGRDLQTWLHVAADGSLTIGEVFTGDGKRLLPFAPGRLLSVTVHDLTETDFVTTHVTLDDFLEWAKPDLNSKLRFRVDAEDEGGSGAECAHRPDSEHDADDESEDASSRLEFCDEPKWGVVPTADAPDDAEDDERRDLWTWLRRPIIDVMASALADILVGAASAAAREMLDDDADKFQERSEAMMHELRKTTDLLARIERHVSTPPVRAAIAPDTSTLRTGD